MKKNKFIVALMVLVLTFSFGPVSVSAEPELAGECAILMEKTTGKILYGKNIDAKAYPASTTKILTALVMLEYIDVNDVIVMGKEVFEIPSDSSKAGHSAGSSISGYNLLRGLMLPSGNESGCVVAMEVARRTLGGDVNLNYTEAEYIFSDLMNKKAQSLGAESSNFVNPHGYHNNSHYTTARDMALICAAALDIPVLAEIIAETMYKGDSVTENVTADMVLDTYDWHTTNLLITEGSEYYYEYARGIKTGFTGPAGYCLASTARKNDMDLIAIVFHSEEGQRYEDSIALYEYGYENYEFMQVQENGIVVDNVGFNNPQLGEVTNMDVKVLGDHVDLFEKEHYTRLIKEIVYIPEMVHIPTEEEKEEKVKNGEPDENEGKVIIKLPIEKNTVIGHISYSIDGEEIYNGELVATLAADERTKESDFEYYKAEFQKFIFTKAAIPYWIALAVIILLIILVIIRLIVGFIRRRRRYRVHYKHRRY